MDTRRKIKMAEASEGCWYRLCDALSAQIDQGDQSWGTLERASYSFNQAMRARDRGLDARRGR